MYKVAKKHKIHNFLELLLFKERNKKIIVKLFTHSSDLWTSTLQ